MPTFQPPYADTVPPVLPKGSPEQDPLAYRLMRHYGPRARGRTVLRIGGTYGTYDEPSESLIDTATECYLGGHVYQISDDVAAALTAAGYAVE